MYTVRTFSSTNICQEHLKCLTCNGSLHDLFKNKPKVLLHDGNVWKTEEIDVEKFLENQQIIISSFF